MSAPAVQIQDLSVVFGSGASAHRALDSVSFQIPENGSVGLVGESGSGKSTLAHVLVGEVPISGGSIQLGADVYAAGSSRRRRRQDPRLLQLIPQDPYSSLNPRRTAGQALAEALDPQWSNARRHQSTIEHWLDRVELPRGSIDKYPHEFSGGQRQRIAIARALCIGPEAVIADEITSALDLSVQVEVLKLLAELREELSLTLLFISHDLAVVRHVSDKVAVLRAGVLEEFGDVEQIFTNPQADYTQSLLNSVPGAPGFSIRA